MAQTDAEKWQALCDDWSKANALARAAQAGITGQMHDCYLGHGTNPSLADLDKAEALWADEAVKRAAMDEFIRRQFR